MMSAPHDDENPILWCPHPEQAAQTAIARLATRRGFVGKQAIAELHRWSCAHPQEFWQGVWDDYLRFFSQPPHATVEDGEKMPGARWFPGARFNYAENLLVRADAQPALIAVNEKGARRCLSWHELTIAVTRLTAALRQQGVGVGDCVAAILPNTPEAIIGLLATSALGAIWSSVSPDYGENSVLDRFSQIAPKVLLAVDGYSYGRRAFSISERVARIKAQLPSLNCSVVIPTPEANAAPPKGMIDYEDFAVATTQRLDFAQLPFDHPLYVLYSSGTTGKPKAIIHSQGGALLQHIKEHRYHCAMVPGERLCYYTTCSWMMWNWMVSALASEQTLVLYDGSVNVPDLSALWTLIDREQVTVFGTSAGFINACRQARLSPRKHHSLSSLRAILSTGSPLSADNFSYVYDEIKNDVHLASICGGTDIVSCFILGNPAGPVRRGEIQMPGLGLSVEVWADDGKPVRAEKGELVCTKPFPVMPIGFWGDEDGRRYQSAYFERFPGIWAQGDFAEHRASGGFIIHGRSDAVLNPGGVRIGPAEITAQAQSFFEIEESLCIGQKWDDDIRVVLFVLLRADATLDDDLKTRIAKQIRSACSPRHVPKKIIAVADLPRTHSGKLSELAVRAVVHGEKVGNSQALANPEALELFRDLPELAVD